TDESELGRLDALLERGMANGVEGLEMIGPEGLRELEPHCAGIRALRSPNAGIVDYGEVVRHYALDVRNAGGEVHTGRELLGISQRGHGVLLQTSAGDLEARRAVVCAGLHADRLAALGGGRREPQV